MQLKTDAGGDLGPASPFGPPAATGALQPAAVEGVVRLWLMVKGEGYLLAFGGQTVEGKSWTMKKFTHGRNLPADGDGWRYDQLHLCRRGEVRAAVQRR